MLTNGSLQWRRYPKEFIQRFCTGGIQFSSSIFWHHATRVLGNYNISHPQNHQFNSYLSVCSVCGQTATSRRKTSPVKTPPWLYTRWARSLWSRRSRRRKQETCWPFCPPITRCWPPPQTAYNTHSLFPLPSLVLTTLTTHHIFFTSTHELL